MRTTLLASAAVLGLALATSALAQTAAAPASAPSPDTTPPAAATDQAPPSATAPAAATPPASSGPATPPRHHRHLSAKSPAPTTFAHEPGTGESGPASARASNIDAADTHSAIAPHLPQPKGGMNAGPWNYLRDAERELRAHKTGEAQQALEMAETRLLDRSTPVGAAGQPDMAPLVQHVGEARRLLGRGDLAAARAEIHTALQNAPGGADGDREGGAPTAGGSMSSSMSSGGSMGGMAGNHPGGAPNGGTPTGAAMAPSGAGAGAGDTAGASVGGGPAGTGTADSAGGAK